jgi:hypothetical protein
MKLNKVEIDYFENRKYSGEPDKRSQQFREVAGRLNDAINEIERMKELWKKQGSIVIQVGNDHAKRIDNLGKALVGVAVIGLIVIGVIIWRGV